MATPVQSVLSSTHIERLAALAVTCDALKQYRRNIREELHLEVTWVQSLKNCSEPTMTILVF